MRFLGGDNRRARDTLEAAVEIAERIGDRQVPVMALNNLGWVALVERSFDEARESFGRSLRLADAIGFRSGTAWSLLGLAHVATATGDSATGALLATAATSLDPGDVPVTKDLGLPEIELIAPGEAPSLREAVELGLSFVSRDS
jgi:hypothetical protein